MSEEQKSVEGVAGEPQAVVKAAELKPAEVKPIEALVSIDDFKKFRIVVAQIKEAAVHPNADKLFVLKVDIGTEVRQVVAGIRRSYTPELLVGKRVALIANLAPAVIRGVESQGMILAASDEAGVSLLSPDRLDLVLGSTVK
ncbi:MAG: methionine--tRNA ligase subunit beta [Candidatus Omnitrophica bacterium]|nr:methionine--tRNA ligase subunit beta [Candidatus Omnitrophota bacterium]